MNYQKEMLSPVEKFIAEQLSQTNYELKKEDFDKYQKSFYAIGRDLLFENQRTNEKVNSLRQRTLYAFRVFEDEDTLDQIYAMARNEFNIDFFENQLITKALEGYEFFQTFRTLLSKTKLFYQIGIESIQKGEVKIMQGSLSFKQLQESDFLKIERNIDGYVIRLNTSQQKMNQFNEKKKAIEKNASNQKTFIKEASSLYSAVYRFYKARSLKTEKDTRDISSPKVGNRGNFYQAYRYLYRISGGNNNWIPSDTEIEAAFRYALSNGGSNGSFTHGGDILSEQDKFYNATFLNINTLAKNLIEMSDIIKESIKNNDGSKILKKIKSQGLENTILYVKQEEETATIKNILKRFFPESKF